MIKNTFALGTWEIHLQTDNEQNLITDSMKTVCDYIDTAVNYNNDYLLSNTSGYKIISKLAPCHYLYYDFFVDNHMKCLKRDKIDIMLIHSNRGNWQDLAVRIENDDRFIRTGVSNFSLDEIEEYKNLIGHYPFYNEIEINPLYTDIKTIKYCKERDIKIISYGIFGGKYRAPTYIARYSLPYLISYASKFSDIVILKPECARHVNEMLDVIDNYVDTGENEIVMSNVLDDKAIIPMTYIAPTIVKKAWNIKTYNNAVGKNYSAKKATLQILIYKPDFEMLGDYMAYLRYLYHNDYDNKVTYMYDILVGDNGKYYVAYLYDKDGNLSKINETGNIELIEITVIV